MKQIFVNYIHKEGNLTYGMAVLNKTVQEDLMIMIPAEKLVTVLQAAAAHAAEGGINSFTRFCQYIVLIQINMNPKLDGSLNFIDCNNDLDSALDEYLAYTKNNWGADQKNNFMNVFQDIQDNPPEELAEMVIKDPADSPYSYL